MGRLVLPYAFSVQHFIKSVGADAGFAAIIGLGILVLLYFAQAREMAGLREQAFESAQQVQELEARLAALARSQAALGAAPVVPGAPGAVPGGGPVAPGGRAAPLGGGPVAFAGAAASMPSPAGAPAVAPAPGAGVGAPALRAATKLIPSPPGSTGTGAAPGAAADAGAHAAAGTEPVPDQTVIGRPPPSTVAALANGDAREHAPPRLDREPSPQAPARPTAGGGTRGRFALLLTALAAVAVVAVLLIVTSIGGGKQTASNRARTSNAPVVGRRSHPTRFDASSVTVAVLNGTPTSRLAHKVAIRLGVAGYREGTIGNTADQTHTATVVAYTPGHKRAGLAVASSLNLGSAAVQPIDQSTQAIACPPPSPCTATVAVTVGADQASQ